MFQQVSAIVLVLALLGGALWFLRTRGFAHYRGGARRKSARHLEPIARLPLTPHHSVHLIRVSDHTVLLALSPSGCTFIERMPWNAAAGLPTAESEAAFAQPGPGH